MKNSVACVHIATKALVTLLCLPKGLVGRVEQPSVGEVLFQVWYSSELDTTFDNPIMHGIDSPSTFISSPPSLRMLSSWFFRSPLWYMNSVGQFLGTASP